MKVLRSLFLLSALLSSAYATTIFGLATDNNIYRFDATMPGMATLVGPNTMGLVDIDLHAANGKIYGMNSNGALFTLNPMTGMTTPVFPSNPVFNVTITGFDFNPAADRIRITGINNRNFRMVPDFATPPQNLNPMPGMAFDDGMFAFDMARSMAMIMGTAYTNPVNNAASTLLYSLTSDGMLNMHPSPAPTFSNGMAVGMGLGFMPMGSAFDIDVNNRGYAFGSGPMGTGLYSVNLMNGMGTFIGQVGSGLTLTSLAVVPEPSALFLAAMGGMLGVSRRRRWL